MAKRGLLRAIDLEKDWWMKDLKGEAKRLTEPMMERPARIAPKDSRKTVRAIDLPDLLTYAEACEKLRICMSTLSKLIGAGELTPQPIRRKRMIRADELAAYLDRERDRKVYG